MRYAVISDIHGNLEALKACLEAISKDGVDAYLCIGDIVGYGANPAECIAAVRALKPEILIAGNHEWGVSGLLDLEYFNEYARKAIVWTKNILSKDDICFLSSFELIHERKGFSAVHGSLSDPKKFNYILYPDDADETMRLMGSGVCFVGHSHKAGIFYYDEGAVKYVSRGALRITQRSKYVINAGSVGQPRDGDPRASYVIYDDENHIAEIKRIEYDIKAAQKKIMAAGLPESLALRLSKGY